MEETIIIKPSYGESKLNNKKINIFVGYDSKEDIAYRVCKHSINNRADKNVKVMSLKQSKFRIFKTNKKRIRKSQKCWN